MQEKILVVDDDPAIIRIVELVLTRIGYEIATANCGEEAYQLASSFQPDLIILDINMPGGWSGFETCRKLKATANFFHIPIVFSLNA